MGMWIGRPGALREFTEAATAFDRSPTLGGSEFRSLSGGVTTWAPSVQPRRLKLAWNAMLPDDLAHLDRLARRVDGPGPVVVIDPAAGNLLTANHAAGLAPAPGQAPWWATPNVTLTSTPYAPVLASLQKPDDLTTLVWYAPTPTLAYPVVPGRQVTWWAPSLAGVSAELRLWCYDATGAYVTYFFSTYTDRPLIAQVPDGVAYVRPGVRLARSFSSLPVGASLLALTMPDHSALRTGFREVLSAEQRQGKTPLSQYAVSGTGVALTDVGGSVHVTLPYASLVNWLPLDGARGFKIAPGQLAVFTTSFTKGSQTSAGIEFLNEKGSRVSTVSRQAAVAPPGAVAVLPWVTTTDLPSPTPLGTASLRIWDQAPPLPAGEGTGLMSITGYGQTIRPGQLDSRDINLDLVEVTSAAV